MEISILIVKQTNKPAHITSPFKAMIFDESETEKSVHCCGIIFSGGGQREGGREVTRSINYGTRKA
jgi:hypothetical protein